MKARFLPVALVSEENRTAPLTAIVREISKSLSEVDERLGEGVVDGENKKIRLESVTASFVLSESIGAEGQLKIWILKLGGRRKRSDTHKITLDLTRGKPVTDADVRDEKRDLTKFINSALRDFCQLNEENLLLDLKERAITLEVGMTITKGFKGGGEFNIKIFTLSAEGGRDSEQGHTLKMVFKSVPPVATAA